MAGFDPAALRVQRHGELRRMRSVAIGYGTVAVALVGCSRLVHGVPRDVLVGLAVLPGLAAAWTGLFSVGVTLLVRGADRLGEK